jgi:hypothetical protein
MTLLHSLIDEDDFTWKDLGYCVIPKTEAPDVIEKRANMWFDTYEENVVVAEQVDEICLSCPVITQCLRDGIENKEIGVFGGIYLENGKISKTHNSHKTTARWKELEKKHGKLPR